MTQYIRPRTPLWLALAASAAASIAACGGGAEKGDALAQDSTLSRDLAMAGQADSAAQPQLQDVPVTPPPAPEPAPTPAPAPSRPSRNTSTGTVSRPRPSTPAPRPSTPAPETPRTTPSGNTVTSNAGGSGTSERSGTGSIEAGSILTLASNDKVCTNTNKVGERFSATITETVTGTNGASIPSGATATVEITELSRSENVRDKIEMGFRIVSVTFGGRTYQVDGTTQSADVSRVRNQPASKDRQKVIGGAIAGAIAGQILGKDTKGTIIGAAAGAAAGAGAAAATANYEGCLNSGGRLAVRLTDAVQVRL